MSIASTPHSESLSERLREQRARLQLLRDQARERYSGGAPGLQVATLICEWTDRLIVEIFEDVLAPLGEAERRRVEERSAIVAIGGTGRGELAPYSDVDLLFLRTGSQSLQIDECISRAVRDCWDAGIKLGHSVRTPGEAIAAAHGDSLFATALVEARQLWGDERLFESFRSKFQRRVVRNRYARFYSDCVAVREAERAQYGVTERQLEPDVKRSQGGLRDIHLLRWVGSAACGTPDIDQLRRQEALSLADAQSLIAAQEFITRIRVDLHFAAGKAQETLTREEQLRLAELHGAKGTACQLPVEQFMQTYFRHSTAIADISARFVARHRPRSLWSRVIQALLSHRGDHIYRISGGEIDVIPRRRGQAPQSLEGLLHLYELAAIYSAQPSFELSEHVRTVVPQLPRVVSPQAARTFLSILRLNGDAGRQLRGMFATGLLDVVVPEITHARCLLQFNQYHAYTVDEHSLRAVEAAEGFDGDPGPIGTAYRKIKHKELLHLALLLHDLGKGFERDHSELGRELALAVADRLFLTGQQRDTLVFLVHKHLLMSHLALRRDLSDPEMLARFSRDVGSPEWLRMLYVMTAADISAVGPGAWTSWKAELVTELFERSLQILSGEPSHFREAERVGEVCRRVEAVLQAKAATGNGRPSKGSAPAVPPLDPHDLKRQLGAFPPHYLIATPPEQIVDDLSVSRLVAEGALNLSVRGTYDVQSNTVEYRVVTRDQVGSGLFSKVTGVLTAMGSQILSANICTTNDAIVIDRFRVIDGDHIAPVPEFRLHEVEARIADVLRGKQGIDELFQRHRRHVVGTAFALPFGEPTRVVIDNDSSERFTIVDVFARDRRGLLYTIAATLLELDLSVSLAKIATHVDQALDVFYVTDREGGKLQDEQRLERIRNALVSRIEEFARREPAPRAEA